MGVKAAKHAKSFVCVGGVAAADDATGVATAMAAAATAAAKAKAFFLPSSKAALAVTPGRRLEDWKALVGPSVPVVHFVRFVRHSAHIVGSRSSRCRRAVALPDARLVARVARRVQFNLVSAAK